MAEQKANGSSQGNASSAPRQFQMNNDNSWYFYNQSARTAGRTEFQRRWGSRKLEDNWRRRNKSSFNTADFDAPSGENEEGESTEGTENTEETRESKEDQERKKREAARARAAAEAKRKEEERKKKELEEKKKRAEELAVAKAKIAAMEAIRKQEQRYETILEKMVGDPA